MKSCARFIVILICVQLTTTKFLQFSDIERKVALVRVLKPIPEGIVRIWMRNIVIVEE